MAPTPYVIYLQHVDKRLAWKAIIRVNPKIGTNHPLGTSMSVPPASHEPGLEDDKQTSSSVHSPSKRLMHQPLSVICAPSLDTLIDIPMDGELVGVDGVLIKFMCMHETVTK